MFEFAIGRLLGKISRLTPVKWLKALIAGLSVEFYRVVTFRDQIQTTVVPNINMDPLSITDYNRKYGIPSYLSGTDSEKIARILERVDITGYPGKDWLQGQLDNAGFALYVHEYKNLVPTIPYIGATSVAWSHSLNLFCTVGGSGSRVMTSPDGLNWTEQTAASSVLWNSITWSPGLNLFCAVGPSSAMTSPDGITWTSRTVPANIWNSITWSQGLNLFCAVGPSSAMTSPDGITWTSRAVPAKLWNSITWSPGLNLFCAVGSVGLGATDLIITSPDGINWTTRNSSNGSWYSIVWSPELGIFCATGGDNVVGDAQIITSTDGINWVTRFTIETITPDIWSDVSWSGNMFVAVSGGKIIYSENGITWDVANILINKGWVGLGWSPDIHRFCLISNDGSENYVITSLDGIHWEYPIQITVPTGYLQWGNFQMNTITQYGMYTLDLTQELGILIVNDPYTDGQTYAFTLDIGYYPFYFILSPYPDRLAASAGELLTLTTDELTYLKYLIITNKLSRNWCLAQVTL